MLPRFFHSPHTGERELKFIGIFNQSKFQIFQLFIDLITVELKNIFNGDKYISLLNSHSFTLVLYSFIHTPEFNLDYK